MIWFQSRAFRSINFVLLAIGLSLTTCHSGKLILRSAYPSTLDNVRIKDKPNRVPLCDEPAQFMEYAEVTEDFEESISIVTENPIERVISRKQVSEKIDQNNRGSLCSEVYKQPETKFHVKEVKNKQYTPSGLKMILVSIVFVLLGLISLYYVPYLGPILAVVFFVTALIYLIAGLYNIIVF